MRKLMAMASLIAASTGCVDRPIKEWPDCPSERSSVRAFEERTGTDLSAAIDATRSVELPLYLMDGIEPTEPVPGVLTIDPDPLGATRVRSFSGGEIYREPCYEGLIATRKASFVLLLDHGSLYSGWGELAFRDDGAELFTALRSRPGASVGPIQEAVRSIAGDEAVRTILDGSVSLDGTGQGGFSLSVQTFNQNLGGIGLGLIDPEVEPDEAL